MDQVGDVLLIERWPRDTLDTLMQIRMQNTLDSIPAAPIVVASRTIPADLTITAGAAVASWISPLEIKQITDPRLAQMDRDGGRLRVWWWKTTPPDNGHRGAVSHRFQIRRDHTTASWIEGNKKNYRRSKLTESGIQIQFHSTPDGAKTRVQIRTAPPSQMPIKQRRQTALPRNYGWPSCKNTKITYNLVYSGCSTFVSNQTDPPALSEEMCGCCLTNGIIALNLSHCSCDYIPAGSIRLRASSNGNSNHLEMLSSLIPSF